MRRLVDLHPRWIRDHDAPIDARQGIGFDCPCCVGSGQRLAIFFANPLSSHPPANVSGLGHNARNDAGHLGDHHVGDVLWWRTGVTFDTLTLTPSIDCSSWKHWHGFITNGEAR